MGVQAVGGYVQGLIKRRKLTIAAVSVEAGVEANYIWRLREGKIKEPAAEAIASLVRAVKGSYDQAMMLLLNPDATEADGLAAAQEIDELTVISRLSPEQRRLIARIAREMLREEFGEE